MSIVADLQEDIQAWLVNHEIFHDCRFKTYDEHFDDKPEKCPCVLVLCTESGLSNFLEYYPEESESFNRLLRKNGFSQEWFNSVTVGFYPVESALSSKFKRYYDFRWAHKLLVPEYDVICKEVYEHFCRHPDDLQLVDGRRLEYLLDGIFRNLGFRTELGPGSGDGGVDLRLYQHDSISEIVTLVQAKRNAQHRPVRLEAVMALDSAVSNQGANRGLFVSTSRYLPSTLNFGPVTSKKIRLAGLPDVIGWCNDVSNCLATQKIDLDAVYSFIHDNACGDMVGKIMHATWGYTMTINDFSVVVRSSKSAVWLIPLQTSRDGDGQVGYEQPLQREITKHYGLNDLVFARKTRLETDSWWGNQKLFRLWDGRKKPYNYCD